MLVSPKRYGSEGPALELVTWADGTDEQIVAMVAAADNGDITLTDYWSVGDERTVHLSAMTAGDAFTKGQPEQDVVLVLMNEGYPGEGNEGIHFVWGQKDCLSEGGRMYATNTPTEYSWRQSLMRTDLNDLYYNALPNTLRDCLKTIYVRTSTGDTTDKIALFAAKEISASRLDSSEYEYNALSTMEYYKTSSNIIKFDANGTAAVWWLRTRNKRYDDRFYCMGSSEYSGLYDYGYLSLSYGVAPFGCI